MSTLPCSAVESQASTSAQVTLFAMPKPFRGHIGLIQRNALQSWTRLQPCPQILLFGDDEGTAAAAAEFGVRHIAEISRNEQGTPLVNDLFRQAASLAEHRTLVYTNSDIILLSSFLPAVAQVTAAGLSQFLMIGRRTDLNVTEPIDFQSSDWETRLLDQATQRGRLAPRVCKDYFVFAQSQFADMPPFAIGRANWDNWMVHHAHQNQIPVIDATKVVQVVHQNHDYAHLAGGKTEAYLRGAEAQRNRSLAQGMHLVNGSTANWKLSAAGLSPCRFQSKLIPFLGDAGRFARLLLEVAGLKRGDWRG